MTCPQCESANIRLIEYDLGIDPDTGYSDAGTRGECIDCGAVNDLDEMRTYEQENDICGVCGERGCDGVCTVDVAYDYSEVE